MTVSYQREDDIFFVELAHPPVNAINLALRDGLFAAITAIQHDKDVRLVILSGGPKIFAAGGDAREFDAPPVAPHLPDVLAMIEKSPVPWVAAITGAALGGGLELALACRYRIASKSAILGLPEVTLGVVPGAGGTQRLPRLIGFAPALEMITSGKSVSSAAALASGLIDAVDDDPVGCARHLPIDRILAAPPVNKLPQPAIDSSAFAAAENTIARRMRGQIAPVEALNLVKQASETDFVAGMAAERATFLRLRQSPQAAALRHVFFAERGARAPAPLAKITPPPISRAVVVGGGTMGAGIAYALLGAGIHTVTLERDAASAATAATNVNRLIDDGIKRGVLSPDKADTIRAHHQISTDFAAASDAQIAIEAAFEDMQVKISVFQALDRVMPADAVLATNTSYLDIDQIAAELKIPSRLIGLHFFVPAHVMKLLEIVHGESSSDSALATGFALAKRLRKIPVLSGVCDGFIGNRILSRYREAADTLLLEGALVPQIDAAMTDFGYAMGPYQTQDMSGLEIAFANRRRQDATRDPMRRYIAIADRMVIAGRHGRKTGAGWYRYDETGIPQHDPAVDAIIIEESVKVGIKRRSFSSQEISQRLLLAMINEAAAILDEGIAQKASDIDLVTILGYGFPRWRGGLMHYADTLGSDVVLKSL
ncbi:MAG: 3-hydroxyacyl-CoA dehydrogenase NAD-binding domain-containing protein, partial [Candidatus Puniceispirillum sp.]